ncbi:hypothetical protein IMSHALPRED_010511 [Imshaugia aleurites]|uniref:Myb-like domain-containing protein n=1 Tax=Imshaugia aleurites TaxID=172621 RepID=A0A8H3G7I2_9LECA|nr:hypothetical protein IMSHALPRED_010511 [Imshaugia aleurites]
MGTQKDPQAKKRQARENWQPWERASLILLRKEGKDLDEISQQLPGRSETACGKEYQRMLKSRKQALTSEEDSLADIQETKRPWKEWEDQVVTTTRLAGKIWGEISRLLPFRTADARCQRDAKKI